MYSLVSCLGLGRCHHGRGQHALDAWHRGSRAQGGWGCTAASGTGTNACLPWALLHSVRHSVLCSRYAARTVTRALVVHCVLHCSVCLVLITALPSQQGVGVTSVRC